MKKVAFFTLFVTTNICFIFLHIYKHMTFIQQSFRKQRNDRMLAQLEQQKQDLTNQLYALQNRNTIKTFAQEELRLKPVSLSQLKRFSYDN